MMRRYTLLAIALLLVACDRPAAAVPRPKPALEAKPNQQQSRRDTMFGEVTKKALPSPFEPRIDAVLAEPLPEDVVVRFASVARAKLPFTNYCCDLKRDGGLDYIKHSGTNRGHWTTPFDQPLPAKPTKLLGAQKVAEVLAELQRQGFFTHPGYEALEGARDGGYTIVRVRDGDRVHTVVFENVKSPLLDYLNGTRWVRSV